MISRDTRRMIAIQEEMHTHLPPDVELRIKALESLLVEKGLLDSQTVDRWIESFSEDIGPKNGARVVARAWCDPDFKKRLLANATDALTEMGLPVLEAKSLVAVENTQERHNVVVCTLCSCYPWSILGLPPSWYKSNAYRARIVRDPRGVLSEFGLELDETTEVRVWDSTSDVRYLVLPERPKGSEDLTEEELAALVTRNSMVGTERVSAPKAQEGS